MNREPHGVGRIPDDCFLNFADKLARFACSDKRIPCLSQIIPCSLS
jgi:hypothetical protein